MAGEYLQHIVPAEPAGYAIVGAAYFNLGRREDAAVQYLAGLLVNAENRDMWTNLSTIYNGLGVQPNPITQKGTRMVLNPTNPSVRQHLNQAALTVVRRLKEAKNFVRARTLQQQFMKQYGVPADSFSD